MWLFEIIYLWIAETLFLGTGTLLKKLAGKPQSNTGLFETWLGFLFYVALFVAIAIFVNAAKTS